MGNDAYIKMAFGENSSRSRGGDGEVYNHYCLVDGWEVKWYYQVVWAARRW
jgi:hypothetical protein